MHGVDPEFTYCPLPRGSRRPGGGEKMSKHSVPGGDISGLLMLFSRLTERAHKRAGEEFPIIAIQEAGLDGFWVHRTLEQESIETTLLTRPQL